MAYHPFIVQDFSSWIKVCDNCVCKNYLELTDMEVSLEDCKDFCKNDDNCKGVNYEERVDGLRVCSGCTTPDDYYTMPEFDDHRVSIYKTCT